MTPVDVVFADGVAEEFDRLSPRFEGAIPWMYRDARGVDEDPKKHDPQGGLVTTAIGVLIDPVANALPLPWVRAVDGLPATPAEIRAEWALIKTTPNLNRDGAGAAKPLCHLRLTADGVRTVTRKRAVEFVEALIHTFPAMVTWPPQARLAVLLHTWAVGTDLPRTYPRMTAALRAQDWAAALAECHISEVGNEGVAPRNVKIKALFGELVAHAPTAPPEATPTQPMADAERAAILALNDATTTDSLADQMAAFARSR